MMVQEKISIEKFLQYVVDNEVVYQCFGELINVSNVKEAKNKEELISFIQKAVQIDAYNKNDAFVSEDFSELNDWATDNDVLFLLSTIGILICVPKNLAVENGLIAI